MAAHPEAAARHDVFVCTACRHAGTDDLSGAALLQTLYEAFVACALSDTFAVSGVNCMAGCGRPCTVGFQADAMAGWLFGDLTLADAPDIIAFAALYASLPDGWCRSTERPGKLASTALARIPAIPPVIHPAAT